MGNILGSNKALKQAKRAAEASNKQADRQFQYQKDEAVMALNRSALQQSTQQAQQRAQELAAQAAPAQQEKPQIITNDEAMETTKKRRNAFERNGISLNRGAFGVNI